MPKQTDQRSGNFSLFHGQHLPSPGSMDLAATSLVGQRPPSPFTSLIAAVALCTSALPPDTNWYFAFASPMAAVTTITMRWTCPPRLTATRVTHPWTDASVNCPNYQSAPTPVVQLTLAVPTGQDEADTGHWLGANNAMTQQVITRTVVVMSRRNFPCTSGFLPLTFVDYPGQVSPTRRNGWGV